MFTEQETRHKDSQPSRASVTNNTKAPNLRRAVSRRPKTLPNPAPLAALPRGSDHSSGATGLLTEGARRPPVWESPRNPFAMADQAPQPAAAPDLAVKPLAETVDSADAPVAEGKPVTQTQPASAPSQPEQSTEPVRTAKVATPTATGQAQTAPLAAATAATDATDATDASELAAPSAEVTSDVQTDVAVSANDAATATDTADSAAPVAEVKPLTQTEPGSAPPLASSASGQSTEPVRTANIATATATGQAQTAPLAASAASEFAAPSAEAASEVETTDASSVQSGSLDTAVRLAPVALNAALASVSTAVHASAKAQAATLVAQPPQLSQPTGMTNIHGNPVDAPPPAVDYHTASAHPLGAQSAGADAPRAEKQQHSDVSQPTVMAALADDQLSAVKDDERVDLADAIDRLPQTDPSLYPAPQAAPELSLTGAADPVLLAQQAASNQALSDDIAAMGRRDAGSDHGATSRLYPNIKTDVLRATPVAADLNAGQAPMQQVLDNAKAASEALQASHQAADTTEVDPTQTDPRLLEPTTINHLVLTEQAATLQAATDQAQAQFAQHNDDYAQDVATEQAQSSADITALETQATQAQQQERSKALGDVQEAKQAWQAEQNSAQLNAQAQMQQALRQGQDDIESHSQTAQDEAQQAIEAGQAQAEQVRMDAEAKVDAEKSKANAADNPDKGGGLFGWIASKAKAVFSAIKSAIRSLFEYARQRIQALMNAAKKAALTLLEKGRQRVIATIRVVGKALLAISDRLLLAFPALSARFNASIQRRLNAAIQAINQVATALKTSVATRLNALASGLSGLVSRLNQSLQTAVAALSSSVQGALRIAADTAKHLGSRLYDTVSSFFTHIPGYHLLSVAIGRDPVTGKSVERNSVHLIQGIVSLIPGGEALFNNLNASGAITRAGKWVDEQLLALGLTWDYIKSVFAQGWASLSGRDLLRPQQAFQKIKAVFSEPLRRLFSFAGAAATQVKHFIFEGALSLAGSAGSAVMGFLKGSGDVLNNIIKDPIGFLSNLLGTIKQGFGNFRNHISKHLQNGFTTWLFGSLASTGLRLPTAFNLPGILSITLQVLGVTWEKIRKRIVKVIGEEKMQRIESTVEFVKNILTNGPAAAWEFITDSIGNLKDMVFGAIQNFVVTKIVKSAVAQLIMMANPVGAVIKAVLLIYDVVMFFVERAKQIAELVQAITASVSKIAAGALGAAVSFIESAMARTIPVMLGFFARLLHLGGIGKKIKGVIKKIQAPINKGIDKLVNFVVGKARGVFGGKTGRGRDRNSKGRHETNSQQDEGAGLFKKLRAYDQATIKGGHKLRFEHQSDLVIHSTPKNLNAFLRNKQEEIHKGKASDPRYAEKQDALNRIKTEKQNFGKILGKYKAKQKANDTADIQVDFNKLKASLKLIADDLSMIGVDIEKTSLVATKVGHKDTATGNASHVWAVPLTKIPGNFHGSAVGGNVPLGWDKIDPSERAKNWKIAQLLDKQLHGPSKEWNLFPAYKTDYSDIQTKIGNIAKQVVDSKENKTYYYDASLNYGSGEFATGLEVKFGYYDVKTRVKTELESYRREFDLDVVPNKLLNTDQLSALNSTTDSFVNQIVKKGQQAQFLKDPVSFTTSKLSTGELVESLGAGLVRSRASSGGLTVIENATLQFVDVNGKVIGGKGPELDFLLSKDSSVVEIISAKLDPKRVKPNQDLKLFSSFQNIPTKDISKLRGYLKENFGNNKAFDQVANVQVSSNRGTQTLDSFRDQYIGASSSPRVVGLTPKSDKFNTQGIQLQVTKQELIKEAAKMMLKKLQ